MSLKDINRPLLVAVFLANVAIFIAVSHSGFSLNAWLSSISEFQQYAPLVVVSILIGVLNAQLGETNKARLVFWHWENPLPGCRAFTKYVNEDARIDTDELLAHYGPLPTDPKPQNSLWFKWYREFREESAIKQVHREYLFTRDYTVISFLLAICLGVLSLFQFESRSTALIYILCLIGQYIFVRNAAKNHGGRFVSSVLAYKSSVIGT